MVSVTLAVLALPAAGVLGPGDGVKVGPGEADSVAASAAFHGFRLERQIALPAPLPADARVDTQRLLEGTWSPVVDAEYTATGLQSFARRAVGESYASGLDEAMTVAGIVPRIGVPRESPVELVFLIDDLRVSGDAADADEATSAKGDDSPRLREEDPVERAVPGRAPRTADAGPSMEPVKDHPSGIREAITPRPGPEPEGAGPALIVAGTLTSILALILARRMIDRRRLLTVSSRNRVLEVVTKRRGAPISAIARETRLAASTAEYHVRILMDFGLVVRTRLRGRAIYFPAGLEPASRARLALEANERTKAILRLLERAPEATVRDVAAQVGVSRTAAHWHMVRIREAKALHMAT
ncbi:MAG: winged helix-turn-helix transcriptional regulator [Euryarchaeota archaeon]|nr:winged helix-turn-helix transcriptional regulator [Euryarchaeota archaeon]